MRSLSLLRSGVLLSAAVAIICLYILFEPSCRAAEQGDVPPKSQVAEYVSQVPKTIIELQQFRKTDSIKIEDAGGKEGVATLINLNPTINAWYLLRLTWRDGKPEIAYHLENKNPHSQRLLLDENNPKGIVIVNEAEKYVCNLWGADSQRSLNEASRSRVAFASLCEGKLYLRNPTKGHRTALETVTDFLRNNIWGGEQIVGFVRDTFFQDKQRDASKLISGSNPAPENIPPKKADIAPMPALIDPKYTGRLVAMANLGINIDYPTGSGVALGDWYTAKDNPGIYVSLIQPNLITLEILQSYTAQVKRLDSVEAEALVYLVAFDLDQFDLGYALGTEHPAVEWSDRVLDQMKDNTLPGPDGIGSIAPLVSTGLINPESAYRTVAVFTGGFKRTHGAFKYGTLALKNHGSHYGFIQDGVVFSKLQPGLSTIFVLNDGTIDMKTWTESDNTLLPRIKHARQNGVPIIEFDVSAGVSFPGPLVGQWGAGNWSGSEDKKLRTVRAAVCLQENQGKRFLIYGYFSSATPSAMARVFQAYRCRYAMHLDMNALEHTYLAVYRRQGPNFYIQHLIQGMNVLDKSEGGKYIPRFVGYADNRDFFYVMRRDHQKETP